MVNAIIWNPEILQCQTGLLNIGSNLRILTSCYPCLLRLAENESCYFMACLTKHICVVGLGIRNILLSTIAAFTELHSGSKSVQGRKCLCCQGTRHNWGVRDGWYCTNTWLGGQLLSTRHWLLGTELCSVLYRFLILNTCTSFLWRLRLLYGTLNWDT